MNIIISLVVPVYNEEENINKLYTKLTNVFIDRSEFYEIIFVNDGSTDKTLDKLIMLNEHDPRVKIINLARNYGKEIAMTAGIDFSSGAAVIPIDADLQDPPELIPELIAKWQEGYDMVYATRIDRKGDNWLKKITAKAFYVFAGKLNHIKIPKDTGDFRIISRPVVEALKQLREQHRFMKGLFAWVGFRQIGVPYIREPRFAGRTKWNYWKLWNFALEGITSISYAPLQVATYSGLLVALSALFYAAYILIRTLACGNPVPGYPSLMVAILLLGGIQLFAIGIIGEYIGRIYNESKRRPLYFVQNIVGFSQTEKSTVKEENDGCKYISPYG